MGLLKLIRLQWDRSIAVVMAAVGLIALLLGYFGTSGTPHVAEQLPYFISGGLFGIFCLTVAAIAWISADLRDEWRELHGIRGLLEEEFNQRGGSLLAPAPAGEPVAVAATYPVTAPDSLATVAMHAETPRRRTRKATPVVEQ
jgi:hypothetical protein